MRDIDIRRTLLADQRLHGGEPDTRVVEELGLCQGLARVDVAVVNGTLHGYEIKSERDTLDRLPHQAELYSRVLDYVTVVAALPHTQRIRTAVPQWWGVWIAASENGVLRLDVSRKAKRNPSVDPFSLAQLLWRDEALEILVESDLASGMRSKSRKEIWKLLATKFSAEALGRLVRERLKSRGANWRVVSQQG
jgi:hypothetical protein